MSYYVPGRKIEPLNIMNFIKKSNSVYFMHEDLERLRAISFGNGNEEFVWVFKNKYMEEYPSDDEIKKLKPFYSTKVLFKKELKQGIYRIDFFDTISGDIVESIKVKMSGGRNIITLPPFKIDMALKILKEK